MAICCFSTPIFFEGMSAEIYPMKTDGVGYPPRSRESDGSYVSCNSLVLRGSVGPWVSDRNRCVANRRLMFVLPSSDLLFPVFFFFDLVAGYCFPLLTGSVPLSVELLVHEDSLWGNFSLWKCTALMFGSNQLPFVSRGAASRCRVLTD